MPSGLTISQNFASFDASSTWFVQAGSGTTSTDPQQNAQDPAVHCSLVVTSDSTALGYTTRGLAMTTAGALRVGMADGTTVIIPSGALAAGIIHPIAVTQVYSTSTGALGIVGFY